MKIKRIFALFLASVVLTCFLPCGPHAAFAEWDGNGSTEAPYIISDLRGLEALADKVADGNTFSGVYFKLAADIGSMSGGVTGLETPIGNEKNHFEGNFDGAEHTVVLNIHTEDQRCAGMFGFIENGEIKNVTTAGSVSSDGYASEVGGVCGYNCGTIKDCKNTAAVSGGEYGFSIGGICGMNEGKIVNCINESKVSGNTSVGGICGLNEGGVIAKCSETGEISGDTYIGGICGENFGNVKECINSGAVRGEMLAGGICGSNDGNISNCMNYGETECGTLCGGICGYSGGSVAGCGNEAAVDGVLYAGGICAENLGTVVNCTNTSEVNGCRRIGGICGKNEGTVSGCVNSGRISGTDESGSICGNGEDGFMINCYSDGEYTSGNNMIGPQISEKMKEIAEIAYSLPVRIDGGNIKKVRKLIKKAEEKYDLLDENSKEDFPLCFPGVLEELNSYKKAAEAYDVMKSHGSVRGDDTENPVYIIVIAAVCFVIAAVLSAVLILKKKKSV